MSFYSETDLRKQAIEYLGHWGHISNVESHATSAGIPDLDFCFSKVEGHIELKFGTEKKPIKFRPTQRYWFKERIQAGGHPWILATWEEGGCCLVEGHRLMKLHGKPRDYWIPSSTWYWEDGLELLEDWHKLHDLLRESWTNPS